MTTTLFALPAGHKKEKEPASVPIADSRLRRVRLCAPAAEHRQLQREHLRQHPRELRADARSSTLGGTAGER